MHVRFPAIMCIPTLDFARNLIKKASDCYASRWPFGYLTRPIFMSISCMGNRFAHTQGELISA